jgi:SAM-dependent methyltransferase
MAQEFPREYFRRYDESNDANFYSMPRKVVHIDEWAIAVLRKTYRNLLEDGGVWLDLMSSWRSHLPDDIQPERVVGLGMNAEEMTDNPQLDSQRVHNLNKNPRLPYDDKQFDAVLCAVSIQYLTQPITVFEEVNRVLKPGGRFIISFSNRCFPSKAVAIWLSTTDGQHIELVKRYFELSGNWENIQADENTSPHHNPLYIVYGTRKA